VGVCRQVSRTSRLVLATLCIAVVAAAPAQAAPTAPPSLAVVDLFPDPGVFDPQFTWGEVTGARGYEVEINTTSFFAPGSKVCCDHISFSIQMTTLGTSYSPPVVLANNTYFWRVRAIDFAGVAGPWTGGPSFQKYFSNADGGDPPPSVPDLRLVDLDLETIPEGSTVATPIVLWDQVPGASGYQVIVTVFTSGACDWSATTTVRWEKDTTTTGWTPLGWSRGPNADPLGIGKAPSDDLITHLDADQAYCVRVRPIDRSSKATGGPEIFGDWTYLPANNVPAFTWSGPPAVDTCSPCSPTAGDYLRPVSDATVGKMPVFTWSPITGAQSYFVVVSRDASFTNIVDYAYTRVTAYAPRMASLTKGYPDETTDYYWAVLPAVQATGQGVSTDPLSSNPQPFTKQSPAPTLNGPTGGVVLSTAATVFHWTPVFGARRYRLQVSDDPTFVNVFSEQSALTDGAVTDSTAYTSSTAYPAGVTLYWRVQAEAEDESQASAFVGLSWSATGTFQREAGSGGPGPADARFKITSKGAPSYRTTKKVTLTVKNLSTNAPVAGASVRVSGAGVKVVTRKTGSTGKVTFKLKAKKYPGTVNYRVTRTGYQTTTYKQSVRRF
jgi:hypothetical protein